MVYRYSKVNDMVVHDKNMPTPSDDEVQQAIKNGKNVLEGLYTLFSIPIDNGYLIEVVQTIHSGYTKNRYSDVYRV